MDGVFVYWLGWLFWVVITFFCRVHSKNYWRSCALLLLLILIPYELKVVSQSFHIVYIILAIYLYDQIRLLRKREKYFSFLLMTLSVAACFAGFRLLLIYDPVIAFIDSRWLLASLVSAIGYFLVSTLKMKCLLSISGLIHGEFLYSLTPFFDQNASVGNLYFFDIVGIVCMYYALGYFLQLLVTFISSHIKGYVIVRTGRQYSGNQLK
ncbi:hypothetical protein [Bacillus sp. JCM 19034]|uniref:YphA family membrane protein n=1 Tax=Bacillus sp. JCM 19034 TaxID=1481928 RepID=UPI00078227F8|nr:hypothetical protein [Bacillus sp. JCM 19034]